MNDTLDLSNIWGPQPLVVVVGAGGMGTAVARRLGLEHKLLLADIDAERLEQQANKLREEGAQVITQVCDVTQRESVTELADRVRELGGFKTLAQVAGLSPSMADWRTIMAVNLVGPALVTEALLPQVVPGCSAVLISSLSAHLGSLPECIDRLLDRPLDVDFFSGLMQATDNTVSPQQSYMWSKVGVLRLARRQALSWGARGGRVVSLSPGLIASTQGLNEFKQANSKQALLQACPLQRQGNVQEIAAVVAFLGSDQASYINGIDLLVDGGTLAQVTAGESTA